MRYHELREQTSIFWHQSIERTRIERFARKKMALITVIGSLIAFYGIAVNYLYSPEQVEKINIFLITPVWQYSSAFLAKLGFSTPMAIAALGTCSSIIAIIFTTFFAILHPVNQSHSLVLSEEDNLSNIAKLKSQFFDDAKRRIKEASDNFGNICWFLLFALVISIAMGVQGGKIFAGICYGFLSYIILFIFRGLFIAVVKPFWKKDCWEMQEAKLGAEFDSIVSESETKEFVESSAEKIEKEEEKRNEEKKQYEGSKTSVPQTKPINEYDSFTWTNEYVCNNEEKCSDVALSILKVSKELLEEGDYSGAAAGFDKVVRALELLKNIDSEHYLPPLFANCYALSQIFAFGLNNKVSACKYAKKACEYAEKCNSDTARRDLAVMRDLYNALNSSNSISSILDEFDVDFPYDILRMN